MNAFAGKHSGSVHPIASIVIATRNRRDDVLRAVASALAQDCPVEILVYDDMSEDGTKDAMRREFPQARVFDSGQRVGLIVNRNKGFLHARTPYVFSIDDDAYFSASNIVSRTLDVFAECPDAAAVAIPYIEPRNRRSLSSLKSPFSATRGEELRSFVGCAHAVRRDLALQAGGYREFFVHQGEERDLCARFIGAGYKIVYGDGAPIVHMVSPQRDPDRVLWYGTRNQIFFEMFNVPAPHVFFRVPWVIQNMIRYRFSWRRLPLKVKAIPSGLVESLRRIGLRKPLSWTQYGHYRRLPSHGPIDWDGPIPAPCHESVPCRETVIG